MKNQVELQLPPRARRLDTVPISEHVYQAIRDAICEAKFEPHAHLVQNQLAEQLRVSRTPVRDALLRLSQEGLIDSVGARGYVVRELTERDILDVYEVRLPLEVLAAGLALPSLTEADIRKALRLHEEIAHPEAHPDDYFELNRRFHTVLIAPCTNTLLTSMLESIWDRPISRRIFKRYVSDEATVVKMIAEHAGILDAVTKMDRERYLGLIQEHLTNAKEDTKRWLDSQPPEPELVRG